MFLGNVWKVRKPLGLIVTGIICLAILTRLGFFDILMAFLLVGAIPGTHYNIPSTFMLLCIISLIWLLLFKFTALEAMHSASLKRSAKKQQTERKKRMPKRRFEQI